MLRAPTIRRNQGPVGARHQMILPKLSYFLQYWVSRFAQKFTIPSKCIVLPVMLCVPSRAGRIPFETSRAEDIILGLHCPPAYIGIVLSRRLGAHSTQTIDVV